MNIIGVISARYDSTRFKGKLLGKIAGKPVIQHTWENAKKAKSLNDLIVACDDKRIFKTVESFGGKAIMTSSKPKNGTERVYEATKNTKADIIVNIQGDEPLLHPSMIDKIVHILIDNPSTCVSSIMKSTNNILNMFDKNVVKVTVNKNKEAIHFSRNLCSYDYNKLTNQYSYYQHIGLYAYTKDFLKIYNELDESSFEKETNLEQMRILANHYYIQMAETKYDTISVNVKEDLIDIENLLKKRDKNEIHDMVKDELIGLSKVMDVSESMRKINKIFSKRTYINKRKN